MTVTIGLHEYDYYKIGSTSGTEFLIMSSRGNTVIIYDWRLLREIRDFVNKLDEEPLEDPSPTCEICLAKAYFGPSLATTVEQDAEGNTLQVCEEHAEELASSKPERAADVEYDNRKDEDDLPF